MARQGRLRPSPSPAWIRQFIPGEFSPSQRTPVASELGPVVHRLAGLELTTLRAAARAWVGWRSCCEERKLEAVTATTCSCFL